MNEFFFPPLGICYRTNTIEKDRKTLVFIHGLTGSVSSWRGYEKLLEHEYNVVAIDLRGHGKSLKYKNYEDYKIGRLAQDIYEIIRHLRIKTCVLISHSFGTLVALEFVLQHPAVAEAAVFLSPNAGVSATTAAKVTKPALKLLNRATRIFPWGKMRGCHIDYSQFPNAGDWDIGLNAADIKNTGVRVYLFCLRHIYEAQYNNTWSHITIPALIVHGNEDTLIPVENVVAMARAIPQSKLIIVNNANHLFVLNSIPETIAMIKNFIQKL